MTTSMDGLLVAPSQLIGWYRVAALGQWTNIDSGMYGGIRYGQHQLNQIRVASVIGNTLSG